LLFLRRAHMKFTRSLHLVLFLWQLKMISLNWVRVCTVYRTMSHSWVLIQSELPRTFKTKKNRLSWTGYPHSILSQNKVTLLIGVRKEWDNGYSRQMKSRLGVMKAIGHCGVTEYVSRRREGYWKLLLGSNYLQAVAGNTILTYAIHYDRPRLQVKLIVTLLRAIAVN